LIARDDDANVVGRSVFMIDGLKVTITGEELHKLLERRAALHRERAAHWERERERTPEEQRPEEQREDALVLPDHICENEADRHEWRAEVLDFLREHLEPMEVYRLGEGDLEFGELLPEEPGWMEQEEYEERNRIGFELERLRREVAPHFYAYDRTEPGAVVAPAPLDAGS